MEYMLIKVAITYEKSLKETIKRFVNLLGTIIPVNDEFSGKVVHMDMNILETLQMTPDMMASFLRLVEYEVEKSELVLALESTGPVFQLRGV